MSADKVFDRITDEYNLGWDIYSHASLACAFIDSINLTAAFEEFLREEAEQEVSPDE